MNKNNFEQVEGMVPFWRTHKGQELDVSVGNDKQVRDYLLSLAKTDAQREKINQKTHRQLNRMLKNMGFTYYWKESKYQYSDTPVEFLDEHIKICTSGRSKLKCARQLYKRYIREGLEPHPNRQKLLDHLGVENL